jgi:hypothetical protein
MVLSIMNELISRLPRCIQIRRCTNLGKKTTNKREKQNIEENNINRPEHIRQMTSLQDETEQYRFRPVPEGTHLESQ